MAVGHTACMKRHASLLAAACAVAVASPALLPSAALPTAEALPPVMIQKIVYDSFGAKRDDSSNGSLNAEYVVLKNTTATSKTITGWTVRDKMGFTYRLPTTVIPGKGTVTIYTGKGTNTSGTKAAHKRFWGKTSYVWNNTGDSIYLRNTKGSLMDSCVYKDRSTKDTISSAVC